MIALSTTVPAWAVMDLFGWKVGRPVDKNDRPPNLLGPFLNPRSFRSVEEIEHRPGNLWSLLVPGEYFKAQFEGQLVFVKARETGTDPDKTGHNNIVEISQELAKDSVGPRFIGSLFYVKKYWEPEETGRFALIYEYIDGSPYLLVNRKGILLPRKTLPKGIKATEQMIEDVQRSFDVLDRHKLMAQDAQFLLTKTGRAYLMDYEFYMRAKSVEEAKIFNDPIRAAFISGIQHNVGRQCDSLLQ